jgi:hypothetical protein
VVLTCPQHLGVAHMLKMMEGAPRSPVLIADTVTFHNGYASCWYFNSVDGSIKRKRPQNVIPRLIVEEFEKDITAPNQIAAFFVATTWDSQRHPTNSMTILDARQLRQFLLSNNPVPEGFLQKWIKSSSGLHDNGVFDSTFHVTWTPNRCEIEKRRNFFTVEAAAARSATMDSSSAVNIDATKTDVTKLDPHSKLFLRIENQCQEICDHIRTVSKNDFAVAHISCYFKIVDGNRLFFLWAR